jgi:hypothetical protein
MTDAVWVAMIVAVPTTIAPVLLRITDSKARQLEKEQDYARQDAVAAKAAEAAMLLKENQAVVREQGERLGGKLDEIHAFVNSDMTAQKRMNLALLVEIVALHRAAGEEPSPATIAAISDLEKEISDRDRAQDAS